MLSRSVLMITAANAKTYTVSSGKWTDAGIWNGEYPGTTIKADDVVIINGHVTMNTAIVVEGTVQVEKGASMIGMKDLYVARSGKFVNNGNTVMKRIINEGTIDNNLIMEAMMDIDNKGGIGNNNNMVAGNNFNNYGGNAAGNGGAYFVNNNVTASHTAKFGNDVRVLYGNTIENTQAANNTGFQLQASVQGNAVVLSVINAAKADVSLFSIEKSNDGKSYQLVDMVSNINKTNEVAASYTDTQVNSNLTYYRVKAITSTGTETELPVAAVKVPTANAYTLAR